MAINVEVWQHTVLSKVPGGFPVLVPEGLPVDFDNVAAAGEVTVQATTRFIRVRNRTGGDTVYCKFRAAGTDNAAADDSHMIAAGGEIWFGVPKVQAAGGYEVDIRAIV